jgi:hypothetical protein
VWAVVVDAAAYVRGAFTDWIFANPRAAIVLIVAGWVALVFLIKKARESR